MGIAKLLTALLFLGLPALGLADTTNLDDVANLPEPETLVLFASAAVAWAVVHFKKRK